MGLCGRSWAGNGERGASVQAQGAPQSVSTELLGAISDFPFPVVVHLFPTLVLLSLALGNTALTYACAGGYVDVVKVLLESGASIEDHNENGHTPLMEAGSAGHVEVARVLLENGAGINTHSNEFKESALTLACYKGTETSVPSVRGRESLRTCIPSALLPTTRGFTGCEQTLWCSCPGCDTTQHTCTQPECQDLNLWSELGLFRRCSVKQIKR